MTVRLYVKDTAAVQRLREQGYKLMEDASSIRFPYAELSREEPTPDVMAGIPDHLLKSGDVELSARFNMEIASVHPHGSIRGPVLWWRGINIVWNSSSRHAGWSKNHGSATIHITAHSVAGMNYAYSKVLRIKYNRSK